MNRWERFRFLFFFAKQGLSLLELELGEKIVIKFCSHSLCLVVFYRPCLPPPPVPSGGLPGEKCPQTGYELIPEYGYCSNFLRCSAHSRRPSWDAGVTKTPIWARVLNLCTYFVYFSLNMEFLWSPENLFALSLWKFLSLLYLFWTHIKR